MRMWKGTASAAMLTASFVALGAGPALADTTNGNGSVLGGNQINAPISAPVDISGNAIAVVGRSLAGSTGGASVHNVGVGDDDQRTSGRGSVGGGNQINAPVNAPVNVCGNAVAVIGHSVAGCEGGAKVKNGGGGGHQRTSGRGSVLGGNQVYAPINAPISICGNSAALLGGAVAGCKGGATVKNTGGHHGYGHHGYGHHGGRHTSGNGSVGGGNQVHAPVTAPVNICGNAVGNAVAGCEGGAKVKNGHGYIGHQRTSGNGSVLGGNQIDAPVNIPVDVCGNAAAVVGRAYGSCGADDCITPSSAPYRRLPQLPVSAASLRRGAAPVAMGALPALPQLPGQAPAELGLPGLPGQDPAGYAPMSAPSDDLLPGAPGLGDILKFRDGTLPIPMNDLNTGDDAVTQRYARSGSLLPGLAALPVALPGIGHSHHTAPAKQLASYRTVAAESETGYRGSALIALALGGLLAASSVAVGQLRRLRRR